MDCSYTEEQRIFRYRAVGLIIENDHILLATNSMAEYFYTIGGAVKHGETSTDAVRREVLEETKLDYEVEKMLTVVENFFDYEFNSTEYEFHEVAIYYLMKPQGMKRINAVQDIGGGRKEHVEWIPLSRIDKIEIKPSILKEIIANIDHLASPLIHKDVNQ
ncbi:NUDIX hydrolase [Salinicoccus hispanicus]|uniref:NUDIX domain-containing protein n=1 Tax=Salinicoccus hispanicus TaxID=157225 RepID=A0A6N8U020_9STAP|nr:NUDIX domain-containing protein [Salinicoccus hispanicus]MXQ50286.1 NUDIX domain-containing protein [Salinicoccus hispanicus]